MTGKINHLLKANASTAGTITNIDLGMSGTAAILEIYASVGSGTAWGDDGKIAYHICATTGAIAAGNMIAQHYLNDRSFIILQSRDDKDFYYGDFTTNKLYAAVTHGGSTGTVRFDVVYKNK
jgi:uncharacterized membrane protein YeaQ/YmgE (transglycosylase-associated protein family)